VERSLEQSVADPRYLEFFGLTKSPFGRLLDPNRLFPTEQYSLLTEHLVNASTHTDSLVVICGADGSGKSTLIDRFTASLDDHMYCVVINETCHGEVQFYRAFLTQIGFEDISGTASELRHITKEFLVCRGIAGDHVLLIIDNAHMTDPIILEQLRWICEIKIKDRRVISVVLAGNADLVHVINAPAMSQIKFSSQVIFKIRNYSREETASYVWHSLRLAGGSDGVKLANEANLLIHRYSGGIPREINRLCNEMLAEAYRLDTRVISEGVVRTVADKQGLLPHVVPLHGKGRRRTDPDFENVKAVSKTEEISSGEVVPTSKSIGQSVPARVDVGPEELLKYVSKLAVQIEDLRADKVRALQDIDARNDDIVALRSRLDAQLQEIEKLTRSLAINAEEITQQNLALSNSAVALQDSENRSKKLAVDAENVVRAKEAAQSELAEAAAKVEELHQQKQQLQATVDEAHADIEAGLKVADERAVEIEALEKNTADLKDELEGKTGELDSLRNRLASRDKDVADLEKWLQESQKERAAAQLRMNGLKDPEELEKIERASDKLAADLRKETRAREAAEKKLAKTAATVEELTQLERELQATVRHRNNDLEMAGERAAEVDVLEKNVMGLKDELEKKTQELDSRNQVLADLAKQLEASQNECALLQRRAPAASTGEEIVAKQAKPALGPDVRVYSSTVVAKFEQSLSNIPAYQTLRQYDPTFYDGLISTYKQLVGQDLTDKQVNDALRAKQVELMEQLLPGVSDEAIIAYARLIVDQLDELRLDQTEPCLTLLIPQSSPDNTSPIYSEITKGRELDTLDIVLRTYDADRQLPTEKDVWPDLGPIFEELFDEFGADNVAAMENSFDPSVDRGLVCNVTRALYSGILKLPERNAANAMRWLLST